MTLIRVAAASALLAAVQGLSAYPSPALHAAPRARAGAEPVTVAQHRAVLDRYCVGCHNARTKAAGLSLDVADLSAVDRQADTFEKVIRKLRTREMPPAGSPRPELATYDAFAGWLEDALDRAAKARPDPGRPALHRLNRTEYGNAVRDLLGFEIDAMALLPADDSTHGFDNVADVLGVSPELLESYVVAARKISRTALGNPTVEPVTETYHTAPDTTQDDHLEELPFGTRGGLTASHLFPVDGEYDIRIRLVRGGLNQIRGLQEPHQVELSLDGERVRLFSLDGGSHMYEERYYNADTPSLSADEGLRVRVPVKAGTHVVAVTFPIRSAAISEDMVKARHFGPQTTTKGLPNVEGFTVTGPYVPSRPSRPPGNRILTCRPATASQESACANRILTALARRAYRGTATDADLASVMRFYEQGRAAGGFYAGIEMGVWRILSSPRFIFRAERDPANAVQGMAHALTDVELASRLSFFLWSSVPDDRLLDVAARGQLKVPSVLEREVRRMLADPRAQALVQNFARQWLSTQKLQRVRPDPGRFPDFDDNLRQAMVRETDLLFERIMREDRSVIELLTADYTFVNERLARHYGIPNVFGSHFRRVDVPAQRRGLLGHASVLTVSSFPTRTSPVLRGKWVLETLIGSPPPPPPANVPALGESDKDSSGKVLTMRERMAQHRRNPVCANCHSRMDPLGLALEPFDAVGGFRNVALDTSGSMPDGTTFDGPGGLRDVLAARPGSFAHAMIEKMLVYALGRGMEYYDAPAVRSITRDAARSHYTFSSIVLGIVRSIPFQMRRAAGAA